MHKVCIFHNIDGTMSVIKDCMPTPEIESFRQASVGDVDFGRGEIVRVKYKRADYHKRGDCMVFHYDETKSLNEKEFKDKNSAPQSSGKQGLKMSKAKKPKVAKPKAAKPKAKK